MHPAGRTVRTSHAVSWLLSSPEPSSLHRVLMKHVGRGPRIPESGYRGGPRRSGALQTADLVSSSSVMLSLIFDAPFLLFKTVRTLDSRVVVQLRPEPSGGAAEDEPRETGPVLTVDQSAQSNSDLTQVVMAAVAQKGAVKHLCPDPPLISC